MIRVIEISMFILSIITLRTETLVRWITDTAVIQRDELIIVSLANQRPMDFNSFACGHILNAKLGTTYTTY